jgi:carbon monoxide dehydrogenase subunit G
MNYERTERVAADPDRLYAVLATPENLAHFVPQLTAIRSLGGDRIEVEARYGGHTHKGEAWLRTDDGARRVEWGVDGTSYQGAFQVGADGDGASLTLSLTTEHERDFDADVTGTLDAVRRLLEAEV